MKKIQAIVTDIEGTTTDIAFVHQVLFPYSAKRLADFVRDRQAEPAVAEALAQTRAEMGDPKADTDAVIRQLLEWIEQDRKITPLKALQGLIWREGYERGDYQGHVYPDAVSVLRQWKERGIPLYIYSSGSEAAQRLLFGHSSAGDLTGWFQGYFDTRVGAKKEAESYRRIGQAINVAPAEILFLSDSEAELDAAREAGWQTCQLVREGTVPSDHHPTAKDFTQIMAEGEAFS
ncbi:MAG: acireductone synthase [Pseudomonadota bacterium]|nr:acireductone synthase [Pseudomonadota bacterium]